VKRAALAVAAVLAVAAALVPHAAAADGLAAESEFLWRINTLRGRVGAPPLVLDDHLTGIARGWASSMAARSVLEHNPNLRSLVPSWQRIGENVGDGFGVAELEQAFEQSPHHYENLVNPAFAVVGIGVVEVQGVMWVAEDFVQPQARRAARPAPAARVVGRPEVVPPTTSMTRPPPPPPPPAPAPWSPPVRPLAFANAALERPGRAGLADGLSGWGPSRFALVRSPARGGGSAQRVHVAPDRAGGTWFELQAHPGTSYRQSVRLAVLALAPRARVEMILEWYDEAGRLVGYRLRAVRETGRRMVLRSQTTTAPAGASFLRSVVNVKGGGTFVMDDDRVSISPR
jgi:hypothetical protein